MMVFLFTPGAFVCMHVKRFDQQPAAKALQCFNI